MPLESGLFSRRQISQTNNSGLPVELANKKRHAWYERSTPTDDG